MLSLIRKIKIKQAFKNNKRKHTFHRLESMKSVLILFHLQDIGDILNVVVDLQKLNIEVALWTLKDIEVIKTRKKDIDSAKSVARFRILEEKDFSKINILSAKVKKEFAELDYDTLIDFSYEKGGDIIYFDYLLAINKAEFCVGCREVGVKNVYDLTVLREKEQKIPLVFDQMKLFLHNICHQ